MALIEKLKFDVSLYEGLQNLECFGKKVGENWPVVYIINDNKEAYVGETHHASVRMKQHMENPERKKLTEIKIGRASCRERV